MQRLTAIGLWLLLGGIALQVVAGTIAAADDDPFNPAASSFSGIGGTAIFAGIIVLIVSAVRGRGQQQQQQVIIHMPHAGGGPIQSQCPHCGGLTPAGRAFCGQCGAKLAGNVAIADSTPAAPASKAPAKPRAKSPPRKT